VTGHDPRPDLGVDDRLRAWLVGTDLSTQEAETGLDRVLREFPVTPQVRRGFLGRWLDRDEGVERVELEPATTSSARRRASLLLSASAVATAFAFIWLAVVIIETDRMAPDPRVADLVVAADGSGDFASIAVAVDAARDGDTIRVQPGTYIESVLVDKDITLAGSDQREDVVIEAPEDGPVHRIVDGPSEPFALALVGSDAEISGLTLTGERSAVIVDGGQPTLRNLHFIDVTEPFEGAANTDLNSLVIAGGSRASVSDSLFEHSGPLGVYASDPSVIGNVFLGGSHIWGRFGAEAVIADNHIDGALSMGVWVLESGPMLIEHNTITGGDATGIDVGSKGDSAARIRNNHIADADTGITVRVGDGVEISGNELVDTTIGVKVARFNGHVDGNEISGGDTGIVVVSGGAPRIADNVIDVSGRGIVAGAMTSPLISGNEVCGGETGIHVSDGATPQVIQNQVCSGDAAGR
jgi:hypothetical protein